MIIAGLKLTLLGMGTVISFLLLLFLIVTLSCRFLSAWSEKELMTIEISKQEKEKEVPPAQADEILVAVISAAIEAYRSRA